jgi:hypothetical protein
MSDPAAPRTVRPERDRTVRGRRKPTTLDRIRLLGWIPVASLSLFVGGTVALVALGERDIALVFAGAACRELARGLWSR